MTQVDLDKIMSLASLWATARCRRMAVVYERGGPSETATNTTERAHKAEAALREELQRHVS